MTVWEKYQKKRADKKKEKRSKRHGEAGEEEEVEDDGLYDKVEGMEDAEMVDDALFEDDPFFQLPDQDPAQVRMELVLGGNKSA